MTNWKPIGGAPKTGTRVLLWARCKSIPAAVDYSPIVVAVANKDEPSVPEGKSPKARREELSNCFSDFPPTTQGDCGGVNEARKRLGWGNTAAQNEGTPGRGDPGFLSCALN